MNMPTCSRLFYRLVKGRGVVAGFHDVEDLLFRREVEITGDVVLQDSGSERVVQLSLSLWRNYLCFRKI